MIISHKHKFAFIKTTKTAGTSVEIALSKHCGDEDVITPIMPEDEAIRSKRGYRGPQNYLPWLPDGTELKLFNHARAVRAIRVMGNDAWKEYFTFAFERNPFDRVVSAYHYIKKNRVSKGLQCDQFTFNEFLREPKKLEHLHRNGWGLYTQNDKIIVDRVYKFEELESSMNSIYDNLGIVEADQIVKTKVSNRKKDYRQYYDDESRALVERAFEKEIETFNYTF